MLKIILFGGTPDRVDAYGDTWVLSNVTPTTTLNGDGEIDWRILVAIGIGAGLVIIVLVVFLRKR